jgi:DNA-binding NarL/FixJ family response regulator
MSVFRILVADDHDIVRQGIKAVLQSRADWEVCGEARDGRQAVALANELKPDIVVMDISMPNLNGLEATREILETNADQKILVMTIMETEAIVRAVLECGARGFLLKSDAVRDLVTAIEALQRKTTFFTPRVAQMILRGFLNPTQSRSQAQPDPACLTRRERHIVQLLAEGKSTKEVATTLLLSVHTVETHRANILRKLKLHSIVDLVLYAVQNNIVIVPTFEASSAS